uniref:Uncharacterized protein n=1 Tax=Anguilla anguilla TaxID=7936 RepID=A0A0E9UDT7_ANGAN
MLGLRAWFCLYFVELPDD